MVATCVKWVEVLAENIALCDNGLWADPNLEPRTKECSRMGAWLEKRFGGAGKGGNIVEG